MKRDLDILDIVSKTKWSVYDLKSPESFSGALRRNYDVQNFFRRAQFVPGASDFNVQDLWKSAIASKKAREARPGIDRPYTREELGSYYDPKYWTRLEENSRVRARKNKEWLINATKKDIEMWEGAIAGGGNPDQIKDYQRRAGQLKAYLAKIQATPDTDKMFNPVFGAL